MVPRGQQHMSTLARHFIRPDGSTFHRLTFDANTGALLGTTPGQGLAESSTWSRGQAWAMYGFTQAYTLTGDQQFLKFAAKAPDYWLRQLPNGCIPVWDFDGGSYTSGDAYLLQALLSRDRVGHS